MSSLVSMITVAVLVMIAGAANAVMDKLQFHYKKSIFAKLPTWNPNESWKNKWKLDEDGNPINGKERFLFSSTALVFITDAWHFFQFVMFSAFTIAIMIYDPEVWRVTQLLPDHPFWNTLLLTVIEFAVLKVLFGVTFEYCYSTVFHREPTLGFKQFEKIKVMQEVEKTWDMLDKVLTQDDEFYGDGKTNGTYVPVTPDTGITIKSEEMAEVKRTPGSVLRDIECYSGNVSEFAREIREKLIDPKTDRFKEVSLGFAVTTINASIAKFKEVMAECEGNPNFEIPLPDGTVGTVLSIVLELLEIDL